MITIQGFRFSGVSAGIKKKPGALDLGLLVADEPVPTAALFTRNLVRAGPVQISERRLLQQQGWAQACLVNSGTANACTGQRGLAATLSSTAAVAHALGVNEERVLPASTGVIGEVLPTEKVATALPALITGLHPEAASTFAEAILTTDRWIKTATAAIEGQDEDGNSQTAQLLAIGKGAGMFHPDVGLAGELPQPDGTGFDADLSGLHATMLVFIVTDAVASQETLAAALDRAADRTFNAATVDGDTSTNDSVYLMASGRSGLSVTTDQLTDALMEACGHLARSMVRDGEGADHLVQLVVRGLPTDAAARDIARTVATSPLVKTALAGKDANWGRLLAAAGRAGVPFDPSQSSIYIDDICICKDGQPVDLQADQNASQRMKSEFYPIELILGSGPGEFSYLTCDLGHGYVDINAGYRS